ALAPSVEPEGGAQRRDELAEALPSAFEQRGHGDEAVDHAVVARPLDADVRVEQTARVLLALVAQRVELRGDHEGGRDAGEIRLVQRADARIRRRRATT